MAKNKILFNAARIGHHISSIGDWLCERIAKIFYETEISMLA